MDDDFDFDIPAQKSKVKKGRRARSKAPEKSTNVEAPTGTSEEHDFSTTQNSQPPRPSRRQMGWDMASTTPDDIFDSRLQQDSVSDSGSEIQVIPDLEELHEDDLQQEMAAPPTVASNNMATFRELDVDLMNQSAFRTLDGGIDMKVLIKNLPSEKEVREEQDVEWEWEKLFAEVCTSLKSNPQEAAILQKPSQERIV
uniref:Intraflagellar transport protein 43 homolog B n=1 Tax=Phallusia mammillata TaxID=59560 RepID=A0A6F9DF92_9ASCI|nr:intraflagellar transport protein 43 homolog B [Phallusia mammillata]